MSTALTTELEEIPIVEEKEENRYSSMTLAELRKEREVQIQLLAFEKVAIIDEAIQNYHKDNTEKIINKETQKLSEIIDILFERYSNTINMVYEKADKNENKYRTQSMENIERIKERHNRKKSELESKKSLIIQRAEERKSIKDQELKEKAKSLARQGEIEVAIQYRTDSELMKELEIQARKNDINCRFERMINNLNLQQENNMKIIEECFERAIDRIQTEKEEELRTTSQALKINIAYALQKTIFNGTKNVKKEKRLDFVQRINDFVQNKIETEKSA